jgi:hypothetical protein
MLLYLWGIFTLSSVGEMVFFERKETVAHPEMNDMELKEAV